MASTWISFCWLLVMLRGHEMAVTGCHLFIPDPLAKWKGGRNADVAASDSNLTVDPRDVVLRMRDSSVLEYKIQGPSPQEELTVTFSTSVEGKLDPVHNVVLPENTSNFSLRVVGAGRGKTVLSANTSDHSISVDMATVNFQLYGSDDLRLVSVAMGWMYFVAWSVSFYPQIVINFQRKSVVGLNFDFLALNTIGFFLYSAFNVGLYAVPEIREMYLEAYSTTVIPVKLNDVFFSVHAFVACTLTCLQCFIYERRRQRISIYCWVLIVAIGLFIVATAVSSFVEALTWLEFLLYASYVKLFITIIKYFPQAFMNFRRKSTIGWSIGNVLLDFVGGMLSILQMVVDSYNFDDWSSFFGDPTKFGLGMFSVCFDLLFMLQHYVLYRDNPSPEEEQLIYEGNEEEGEIEEEQPLPDYSSTSVSHSPSPIHDNN